MHRIGARNDHKVGIHSVVGHGADFVHHGSGADQCFAVKMPAALWKDLVFHVKRRSAGAFVFHHGAYAALHFAVARVGIGDDREFGCIADFTDGARHFRQGDQSNIGISARIGGCAS